MVDYAALEMILDKSIQSLASANLAQLHGLAEQTEAALSATGPFDKERADRLVTKAALSNALIGAALKGVSSARQRANELTDQGRFSTYQSGGQRVQPGLSLSLAARRL
ncbi:hypothetical protein Q9295_02885 [Xinfangfangia sp. CPCC 101601]|uniref:Flagellar protein FlgN n=1 Tax=Pseudogemmobacter lacusdianii TaxID=3069608 RepID=A0ABU0VUS1_9RHOB|nr:hypothetical protein [Xinfangfangia sp. CPCC 101601]MDQ2065308.1 hypothetical protein [Xinfangfangia sp. CPCC 101601]